MSSQNTGIKHQLKKCHGFPTDQILLLWNKVYFKTLELSGEMMEVSDGKINLNTDIQLKISITSFTESP